MSEQEQEQEQAPAPQRAGRGRPRKELDMAALEMLGVVIKNDAEYVPDIKTLAELLGFDWRVIGPAAERAGYILTPALIAIPISAIEG